MLLPGSVYLDASDEDDDDDEGGGGGGFDGRAAVERFGGAPAGGAVGRRFRVGFGRRDMAANLALWDAALAADADAARRRGGLRVRTSGAGALADSPFELVNPTPKGGGGGKRAAGGASASPSARFEPSKGDV